ncbi:hypothetical protein [Candidatus Viadribacter manganicus]|uniref:Uncharacterized protein n=1 Tax=Candidatus Viadribacter manganicus TaxID=1759059 RepID=A0A1B1AJC7_9PROT|nr:hypothetical protein [Candidatus Viadribacter manganicus]ANP46669.1 hypothetical protein ATE48_12450 [Candidatus Viadribacter manganicus]
MKKFVVAAVLALSVSAGAIAYAQVKDEPIVEGARGAPMDSSAPIPYARNLGPQSEVNTDDARSLASDQAVGDARRYYRAQCNQYESPGFCDCVTAGVAQALMPEEVRIAGRTIGERINAQGDAAIFSQSDATAAMSSAERIEQIEGHYADACAQFRG